MQMILKGVGTHIEIDLKENKNAVNLHWLCRTLDINYSTVNTYINRDGLDVNQAIHKALSADK